MPLNYFLEHMNYVFIDTNACGTDIRHRVHITYDMTRMLQAIARQVMQFSGAGIEIEDNSQHLRQGQQASLPTLETSNRHTRTKERSKEPDSKNAAKGRDQPGQRVGEGGTTREGHFKAGASASVPRREESPNNLINFIAFRK